MAVFMEVYILEQTCITVCFRPVYIAEQTSREIIGGNSEEIPEAKKSSEGFLFSGVLRGFWRNF